MTKNTANAERWALAGLSLSMLMPSLDTSIAHVGLPAMAAAFGASFQQAQWIIVAYLLAITTLIVSAGRLGDIVGRRRLLLFGIGLFTGASLLCGLAPNIWLLIAARAVQGVGAAVMMSLTMALVSDMVPKERIGRAMGLLGTMSAMGTTLGPTVGGLLIAGFGWRTIFLINVPLGILNLLLALRTLPVDRARAATSPSIDRVLFRDPTMRTGLAVSTIVATVMMATLVVGPFYLSRTLGLDAARVGLVMSAGPLVAVLTGMAAGRMVDRAGAGRMTILGLSGMTLGLLSLSVAPGRFGVPGYLASIVIVTAHYALLQTANNAAVMANAAHDQRGTIAGMLGLSRNIGFISGASVMGAVFASAGMMATFMVAAALTAGALALGIANARTRL